MFAGTRTVRPVAASRSVSAEVRAGVGAGPHHLFDARGAAGQAIARLQREGLGTLAEQRAPVDGVVDTEVAAALKALADAAAA